MQLPFACVIIPVALGLPALIPAQGGSPPPSSPSEVRREPANAKVAAPTGRIGFVDVELIIENSRAIKEVLDKVDVELAEKARNIDEKKREFRRLRFQLDQQERVLTDKVREQRRGELSNMLDDIDELEFRMEKELRGRQDQIDPVIQKIMDIVADVGEREKYDMVLRGEVVIFGSRAVDLTPTVVEELDKRSAELDAVMKTAREKVAGADRETTGTERLSPRDVPRAKDALDLIP